jgi:hypothetical protein
MDAMSCDWLPMFFITICLFSCTRNTGNVTKQFSRRIHTRDTIFFEMYNRVHSPFKFRVLRKCNTTKNKTLFTIDTLFPLATFN